MIELGQDATGRWAWMIRDRERRIIASDDDYREAALALESALRRRDRMTDEDRRTR